MSFSRTTHNGRRITATARMREQPDTKALVSLVLHLADQLHADKQAQQRTRTARDDHHILNVRAEERKTDDTLTVGHRD